MSQIRENRQELDRYMQKIGNTMLSVLDVSWEKAVIGYFIETSEVRHFQFWVLYTGADDYEDLVRLSWDVDKYDDAILDLQDLCEELHDMCEKVHDAWSSVSYVLENDGSYNADYGYDAIDNYDARFMMEWQSRYLD